MKFRTRITVAFAIVSLLMIAAELLISHRGAIRHDQQVAASNLLNASQLVARSVDMLLAEISRDMKIVASSAFINEPGRSIDSINRRLAEFCSGSAPLAQITFLDTAGTVVADSRNQALGQRLAGKAWLLGSEGKSGFLIRGSQGQPLHELLYYAPVRRDPGEQPKGVIVGQQAQAAG